MKLSAEWVNKFLTKSLKTQALADAMELAGVEVEAVLLAKPFDDKIVVGKVVDLEPHPNANKLKLAQVDVGKSTLSIVCGAPNIQEEQLVPVAQVGAVLPDGTKIEQAVLRGVHSHGMICSESELGLSSDHSGIMVLPANIKISSKINNIIQQHDVIDVKTAANRWDLNSVIGVAREVAAQTDQKLKLEYPEQLKSSTTKGASIAKTGLANRFMLVRLKVKTDKRSPQWLVQHLQAAGVRSISPIVDATNCIMLEYGQPLHAFDASKVEGDIQVRLAKKGETLTTLDSTERKLDSADIVIADTKKVIGIAGVMGGGNSEIDDSTTEILLEAASFHPASLRKTAIRHGLRTDASARFERGIPVDLQPRALNAAVKLLSELVDAEVVGEPVDIIEQQPTQTVVTASPERINSFLGLNLKPKEVTTELAKLLFGAKEGTKGAVSVSVPWWRPDVTMEEDLAEEVIKLVGYDKLPATIPAWRPAKASFDNRWNQLWQAKAVLLSLGLFEVVTYSFISKDDIARLGWDAKDFLKLQNPLSSEQAYLRETLLPSHLNTMARNRTYAKSYGIFEISKAYFKQGEGKLPTETQVLGVMTVGPTGGYASVKAALDRLAREFNVAVVVRPKVYDKHIAHPTRSGEVMVNGKLAGLIGQLHPSLVQQYKLKGEVGYMELSWDTVVAQAQTKTYRMQSRFQSVERDVTLLLDRDITWQQVKDEVESGLKDARISFVGDYYGSDLPADKKSLTLRIQLVRDDRTLTEAEVAAEVENVQNRLKKRFNAQLR
ncbi:phenylalanine--tRNA ligase subunit beta [Patescibacteria group bacterium]|nr:MAG: phenylalanine--tRNA ligase subunit beta [Patescibacteria group bacterium]